MPPVLVLSLLAWAATAAPPARAEPLLPLTTPRHPPVAPQVAPPVSTLVRPTSVATPAAAAIVRPVAVPLATAAGSPGQQCRQAIRAAEQAAGIPSQLMAAIGRIESGRREPDGSVNPWPWSFNADGIDHVFETKPQAIAAVRAQQAQGVRSIDVGCMQVNLMFHPDAFASLEEAFDPPANARYAARFLLQLKEQTGAWPTATAWYHSATPALGEDYRRKVMAVWPEEQKRQADDPPRGDHGSVWAAARPGGAAPVGSFQTAAGGAPMLRGEGRIIPLAAGATIAPVGGLGFGRGLAAYRSMPIPLAARPLPLPPSGAKDTSRG